jgi:peptidoglycan/LPS O-acetylase OafA/YrhL
MTVEAGDTSERGPDRFISQAGKLGYTGPFDGLRGGALIMVLIAHASIFNFASFAVAVDCFFVISGFLIITLILEEDRSTGRLNFRNFYVRRALRLFPVLYTALILTLIFGLIIGNKPDTHDPTSIARVGMAHKVISDVISAGLYVYHVVHPVNNELVGSPNGSSLGTAVIRPLAQVWSLSVEEHFYLIAAVLTVVVIRKKLVKPLVVGFIGLWAFIGVARALGHVGYREMWYQRPDALLLGVALAFIHASTPKEWSERAKRRLVQAGYLAWVVLIVDVFVGTVFAKKLGVYVEFTPPAGKFINHGLYWGRFGFTIASGSLAVIVWSLVRAPDQPIARWLSLKWLRSLGRRSYVVYIVHVPLAVLIDVGLPHMNGGARFLMFLVLLVVLSEGMHRYIEQPALKLKHRFTQKDASGIPNT